ncbi:MAG: ferritin-like domain-containing protein, partial [Pyrinomonadaceae bacterium]
MEAAESLSLREGIVAPPSAESDAVRQMVLSVGIPLVEGAETAKEYAIGLLKLTAEVEHALMVQYLYAAFSLKDKRRVLAIAVQEMGHLTTIQNLLLLLGGRDAIYMQRDLIREGSEQNPIPFVLEPISKVSLAKYVAAEKPATVPPDMEAKVAELVQLAEADAGVETHRVGIIFELLKWVFLPPETEGEDIDFALLAPLPEKPHLSDQDLQDHLQDVPMFEALAVEEWEVFDEDVILPTVRTRAEALDALDKIARQGEGLSNGGPSHFTEFMAIVASFEAGNISVKPVPKAPTLGAGPGQPILHPYSRLWCEVFNWQYNLLVLSIYHALITARPNDGSEALRAGLTRTALFSMRQVIDPLAVLITSLPLNTDGGAGRAGPTFDLDASILESNSEPDLVAQHIRMLDALTSVYGAIELSPDFTSFPAHA